MRLLEEGAVGLGFGNLGFERMLDLWECGHMGRNTGFSYPRIFNGCLIVKRRLSAHNVVRGMFIGHDGHGNALLFFTRACLVVDFSLQAI